MKEIIDFLTQTEVRNIALIQAVVISVIYVLTIWVKYGAQPSVSQSWDDMVYKRRWTFRAMIFSVSIGIMIGGIDNVFMIISGALLTLVGFFTHINVHWKKVVHLVGAIGCILFAMIGIVVAGGWFLVLCIAISCAGEIFIYSKRHSATLWNLELIVFTGIFAGLAVMINIL